MLKTFTDSDPRFILAANSRAKLKVSREMLALCFTQMHTMPEFLLFLFPFGLREYAQDFHFSGFRQRTRLATTTSNASPQDRQFQICFNLKSVERSDSDGWSIRHCAVHHSFHLDEVRTSWIIVKANELINQRIESATNDRGPLGATNFDSVSKALEASLRMHITFCDWSAENWRWYINSLEDNFEGMTRRTYSAPVNVPFSPTTESERFTFTSRTNTQRTDRSIFSFSRTQTQATEKNPFKKTVKQLVPAPRTYTNPDTGISQPLPPDEDDDDNDDEQKATVDKDDTRANDGGPIFSFGKLRKVHKIAEKANEALLVLKHNKTVLAQMKHYYKSILKRRGFPKALADSCYDTIEDFEISIEGLENDMQSQILRLETLLRLLEDRKTLVKQSSQMKKLTELRQDQLHSILDYQNTQTNKRSSKSMVLMTEDMNDIARKTKIETVSMKVITLVTLFFLPGTFISVGTPPLCKHQRLTIYPHFTDPHEHRYL